MKTKHFERNTFPKLSKIIPTSIDFPTLSRYPELRLLKFHGAIVVQSHGAIVKKLKFHGAIGKKTEISRCHRDKNWNFIVPQWPLLLLLLFQQNCSIKSENRRIDFYAFDLQEIKRVRQSFYILKNIILTYFHLLVIRHYVW